MSKIIFLNGCGSSGKTFITRSIDHLSDELWLTFGVDTFIGMLPYMKQEQYYSFVPETNEYGTSLRVETTPKGSTFFGAMPQFAKLLADLGHNLIIDEVLLSDEQLAKYVLELKDHTVYYIGVFCDLKIMQEREILRRDRCIGLANDQITHVHQGLRSHYDFRIDTTHLSSFEAAHAILDYIERTPTPQSFKVMS